MGEVYLARDTRLERTVAIKVLPADLSGDPQFRSRLEHEGRTLSRLNHRQICTLYDVGYESGVTFLVMEYLDGETLASRLQREIEGGIVGLPLNEALKVAIEIAGGLHAAHSQGITHRDLKPSNVMLTKAGVKLVDFGLAKPQGPSVPPGDSMAGTRSGLVVGGPLTASGMIVGTFQYMAPEQVDGKTVDARTDIFALGALLHEIVTGRRAFTGETPATIIASVLKDEPPPVSSIQPLSPRALDFVVRKCLAKDPDDRWQSAADVKSQLEWIAEEIRAPSGDSSFTKRVGRSKREALAWSLAIILAIAALSAGISRETSPPAHESDVRFEVPTPQARPFLSLSPDGRLIAYVARSRDGISDMVWVRPLASTVSRPIAGTEGASFAFWSPDSRTIGFVTRGTIRRIDAAGGSPTTICVCTAPDFEIVGSTWSATNTIMFSSGRRLVSVAADGGGPTSVTTLDRTRGESAHWHPAFLPDGRHFLFAVDSTSPANAGIYVGSLDSPERTRLLDAASSVAYAEPGFLVFYKSGALVAQRFDPRGLKVTGAPVRIVESVIADPWTGSAAFAVSANGTIVYRSGGPEARRLQWFNRTGTPLEHVGEPAYFWSLALSPDEKRVAQARPDADSGKSDVWTVELSTGIPTRMTFSPGNDDDPAWSPDGRSVTFWSDRNGTYGIYKRTLTSAEDVMVYQSSTATYLGDWSRNGKFLLFHDGQAIHALPMTARPDPVRLVEPGYKRDEPHFSPDGQWVAYSSNESGALEVYVASFPTFGQKHQVSLGGGGVPWWRSDGRELFYMSREGNVMSVAVKAGPIVEFDKPTMLFESPIHTPSLISSQYAVASNGQRFLLAVPSMSTTPPITVVLDWTKLLPR